MWRPVIEWREISGQWVGRCGKRDVVVVEPDNQGFAWWMTYTNDDGQRKTLKAAKAEAEREFAKQVRYLELEGEND